MADSRLKQRSMFCHKDNVHISFLHHSFSPVRGSDDLCLGSGQPTNEFTAR